MSIISSKALPPPKSVERSLHFRFVFLLRSTQTARLVTDVVALGRGRVTVVLHVLTVQSPLPSAVVNSLVGVLRARLNAAKPGGVTA